MRRIAIIGLSGMVVLGSGGYTGAQVAGSTTVGVTVEELKEVAVGWSAKRQILGQRVYNDKKGSGSSTISSSPRTEPYPTRSSVLAGLSVSRSMM
jgi:hypothetical protein